MPASPATIGQSVSIRRHSVSQEAHIAISMYGNIKRDTKEKSSRPRSADMSSYQEGSISMPKDCHHSNSNKSEKNLLKLPQIHPPPVKRLLLPLDTPPSPVPMTKMSPKVAASLEKINQLLAANPSLQHANTVSI